MFVCLTHLRHPIAAPACSLAIESMNLQRKECMKQESWKLNIRSSVTSLVFAATRGIGHETTTFYKRLASLLSDKLKEHYAVVLGWIRCCLSLCLVHSAIKSIRRAQSSEGPLHQIYFNLPDSI